MLLAFAVIDQGRLRSSWPVEFFSEGEWWKDDNAPFFLITIIFAFLYPVSRNHHLCFGTSPGIQLKSMHANYASICQFTIRIVTCWESDDTCCGCCRRCVERDSLGPKCFMGLERRSHNSSDQSLASVTTACSSKGLSAARYLLFI